MGGGTEMVARPRELRPDRSARDFYGSEIRRHRTEAGLTLAQLAAIVNYSKTHLGNIETADRMVPPDLPAKLDAAFGTDGHFARLYPLARREAHPDKYRRFMEVEARALTMKKYLAHTVPGLLQTADYAHAMLSVGLPCSEAELENRLAARMERQALLTGPAAPRLWVVLDESVIRRPVGGPAVMRAQLARLLEAAKCPRITIQVLPFAHGEHHMMGGSLTILDLPDHSQFAYLEGPYDGELIDDEPRVRAYVVAYDHLAASALSPIGSAALIQRAMEGSCRDVRVPSRSERRRLAQKQLQQSGRRRLR